MGLPQAEIQQIWQIIRKDNHNTVDFAFVYFKSDIILTAICSYSLLKLLFNDACRLSK